MGQLTACRNKNGRPEAARTRNPLEIILTTHVPAGLADDSRAITAHDTPAILSDEAAGVEVGLDVDATLRRRRHDARGRVAHGLRRIVPAFAHPVAARPPYTC